jgi:hypothetical protein
MLAHLIKNDLKRSEANTDHIFLVDQNLSFVNTINPEKDWVSPEASIAAYGYLYANEKCLNNPESCQLHIALHGCKMTDSYNEDFQKKYESQVLNYKIVSINSVKKLQSLYSINFPFIENKTNNYGLLKFVLDSGYIDYAEENDLMILFPQTWISKESFPYNPKGCWDWYGWTGDNYATNQGVEAKWLMKYIKSISKNPKAHILNSKPKIDFVNKKFPRLSR